MSLSVLTFLQNVEMFPENVSDVERRPLQQRVASLLEQLGAAAAVEARHVDAVEREVVNGPLQPQLNVLGRPAARICTPHITYHCIHTPDPAQRKHRA